MSMNHNHTHEAGTDVLASVVEGDVMKELEAITAALTWHAFMSNEPSSRNDYWVTTCRCGARLVSTSESGAAYRLAAHQSETVVDALSAVGRK